MTLCELIASAITQILEESNGCAEIQRNELASNLGCVPSQINYVISSRFTPELGYSVESRRGGGGYIRITRSGGVDGSATAMRIIGAVGSELDQGTARSIIEELVREKLVCEDSGSVMLAACSENALKECPALSRDKLRAAVFKQMLLKAI